ncbi:hypothetical protein VNO77_21575 [Canavalia gladiata]|uniref:CCHC-type domain-containing protein n=1 Tax=Canavalia gladiata TaxID=3824 RepID=A0AAN9LRM1_CANGL
MRHHDSYQWEGGTEGFFKYERLANLCYRCGKLDHVLKDCKRNEDEWLEPGGGMVRITIMPSRKCGSFRSLSLVHVPRMANQGADRIAKLAFNHHDPSSSSSLSTSLAPSPSSPSLPSTPTVTETVEGDSVERERATQYTRRGRERKKRTQTLFENQKQNRTHLDPLSFDL